MELDQDDNSELSCAREYLDKEQIRAQIEN